ncbi:MAG: hypothetical protein ACTHLR_02575, partial [Rhizomicrobium sp.]
MTQEPRVLRQIRTFREKGWAISVIGYPGRVPIPVDWEFFDASEAPLPPPHKKALMDDEGEPMRIRHMLYKDPGRAARLLGRALVIDPLRGIRYRTLQKLRAAQIDLSLRIYDKAQTTNAGGITRALADRLTTMSSRRAHSRYWTYRNFRRVRDSILDKVSRCD